MQRLAQLSALAHPQRLALFRLLMRRYPDQVPAGELAGALGVKANTLSSYLAALQGAGLIRQLREGRSLRYSADVAQAGGLVSYLYDDCCRGRPELCPVEKPGARVFNVLFLCTGNSARSIFAEAILRKEGAGRFNAYSAGTEAAETINPIAREMLSAKGYPLDGLAPKTVESFRRPDAPVMDFVFTVCDRAANEDCPAWPGQPISAHWGLPDPVKAQGPEAERRLAFQAAYGVLANRIRAFVALPVESLDRIALQHHLDDIALTETEE